ncbi:TM0996/MTH895 family glutaredoxin-like protein [candidate division KSB1 bacterium]|nr:TM0996/MTH895 family glutaredoxin-like protein [candidate division KSB1 bacterium]
MQVKVLGTGCPKCIALEERVKKVAEQNGIRIELEKVTNITDIMRCGVMMTPGLVVAGEVKSVGRIPSEEQILAWIQ